MQTNMPQIKVETRTITESVWLCEVCQKKCWSEKDARDCELKHTCTHEWSLQAEFDLGDCTIYSYLIKRYCSRCHKWEVIKELRQSFLESDEIAILLLRHLKDPIATTVEDGIVVLPNTSEKLKERE